MILKNNRILKTSVFSFAILLLITACSATGGNELIDPVDEEIVIMISGESNSSGGCSRKCLRISDVNVQFDDCYNEDTQVFQKTCETELNAKEIYSTLLKTDISYWVEIENEIDANSTIDAGLPIIVTVKTKDEKRSFILLGIDDFPTEEYGKFMAQVQAIFDNWDEHIHVDTKK